MLVFPDGTGPAVLSCLIGGIPLNQAHDLNFSCGEVRYNISYETIRKDILANKPTKEELELLSIKYDRLLESDRLNDETIKPSPTLPRKKSNKKDKEMEQSTKLPTHLDSNALGLFSIIGISGVTLTQKDNEKKEFIQQTSKDNGQVDKSIIIDTPENRYDADLCSNFSELKDLEKKSKDAFFSIQELESSESSRIVFEEERTSNRTQLAKQKMEEYLDQDDGSSDWINIYSDLTK